MASAAVIASSHPLTASSRSAQRAMDHDDENDLLAIRITAPGDATELERDYADDLEDLVALSVAQHLGPKRSRLPRLHLQPPSSSSSAMDLPKSPSLYASPRTSQGWETLQAGTAPPVSSEPLSVAETAADAAVLLPRPSRALQEVQRRLVSERSTRIPEKRKTATAEQRSVSQPPAARVRPPAARADSSQIPPTSSSSRPRLATATDLPSRLPTPRRRVPSQGPSRSFSPRTGTGEDPITPAGATTELELEEIVSIQTTKTLASLTGRAGSSNEDPAAAATAAAAAARRLAARPATARVSTSRRTASTARMRTKSAPWPTAGGAGESNEPLPPWFDDSGPRIYRSSEGELIFARATDPGPSPSSSSSSAAASTTASLPLHYHRPQDRVLPAVAKRIEAERLRQLQADDPGLGNSWLVSEWGVAGDPRRAVSVPRKGLKLAEPADHSQQQRDSTPTTTTTSEAPAMLPRRSSRIANTNSRPTEAAAVTQLDPPEPPGGGIGAAAVCTTTTTSSSPPRAPPRDEPPNARPRVALAEEERSRSDAAVNPHQTGSSSSASADNVRAVGSRHDPPNILQDVGEPTAYAHEKSPGCCASCVIS